MRYQADGDEREEYGSARVEQASIPNGSLRRFYVLCACPLSSLQIECSANLVGILW